nr:hypothetical protein [uncultured Roseibium sp.]
MTAIGSAMRDIQDILQLLLEPDELQTKVMPFVQECFHGCFFNVDARGGGLRQLVDTGCNVVKPSRDLLDGITNYGLNFNETAYAARGDPHRLIVFEAGSLDLFRKFKEFRISEPNAHDRVPVHSFRQDDFSSFTLLSRILHGNTFKKLVSQVYFYK